MSFYTGLKRLEAWTRKKPLSMSKADIRRARIALEVMLNEM